MTKLNIKEAHESFVVLKHSSALTNPYYLKDRRKQNNSGQNLLSAENKHGSSEPFQKVDISRIRSPNIPFVGSGRATNQPLLLLDKVWF